MATIKHYVVYPVCSVNLFNNGQSRKYSTVSFFYLKTLVFGYLPASYGNATWYPITGHQNEHKTVFTVSNYPSVSKFQAFKENCDFLVELCPPLTFSAQISYPGSQDMY